MRNRSPRTPGRAARAAALLAFAITPVVLAACGTGNGPSVTTTTGLVTTTTSGSITTTTGATTPTEPTTTLETTTTTIQPTTTTAPTTTTTTTTTTSVPSTTTTSLPSTTTTAPTTTTTTPGGADNSNSWLWLALILVAAVALILWFVVSARRKGVTTALTAWTPSVDAALVDARACRDELGAAAASSPELTDWPGTQRMVESVASRLDVAAAASPSLQGRDAAAGCATALRELLAAVGAARLLHLGPGAPTPAQVADAERATSAQLLELESSIGELSAVVHPPEPTGTPTP